MTNAARREAGRVLALDVGDRRIGVAISDPLLFSAQPLETIARRGDEPVIVRIIEIVGSYNVAEIVVGIPYSSQGELTQQARKIERFAERLAGRAGVPVERWDERHTTLTAERVLLEADARRDKRRLVRDKMAAAVLLQDYLEARKRRRAERGGEEEPRRRREDEERE
jgi:putative Holliday junction resolvase